VVADGVEADGFLDGYTNGLSLGLATSSGASGIAQCTGFAVGNLSGSLLLQQATLGLEVPGAIAAPNVPPIAVIGQRADTGILKSAPTCEV
jgi:hypothetical protein